MSGKTHNQSTEAATNCDQSNVPAAGGRGFEMPKWHLKGQRRRPLFALCFYRTRSLNAIRASIEVKVFKNSHDRFLIIDENIYHFGASIKDLGKKWFAVTLMTEYTADELLHRL